MALSDQDAARIKYVIDYMVKGGAGRGPIDQISADQLAAVFGSTCGFKCGCPGTFLEGLRDTPITTLLQAMLCPAVIPIVIAANPPVPLLTAATYGILAGTTVTNSGPTVINGDLGLSPGTAVTGFDVIDAGPGHVNGNYHITDTQAAQAQLDLTAAYIFAAALTSPAPTTVSGDQAGVTLTPGLYKSTSTLSNTGVLTLDAQGNSNASFVFQVASALTIGNGSSIVLANGASARNIFWQVGSSASLGTTAIFKGSILALTSITVNTGATVVGRLLARNGQVTLLTNNVTVPV